MRTRYIAKRALQSIGGWKNSWIRLRRAEYVSLEPILCPVNQRNQMEKPINAKIYVSKIPGSKSTTIQIVFNEPISIEAGQSVILSSETMKAVLITSQDEK